MRGALALMAAIAVQVALTGQSPEPAQPAPQTSPLKEIIDVKSRALCTALRDNVAVTLAGLISNDTNIAAGRRAMMKLAYDQVQHSTASHMDALQGENVVGSIVHNLAFIDQKLNDQQRFPATPATDDEKVAAQIKAQLQAIEDAQKAQLNALYGTIDTDNVNSMQHDMPANQVVVSSAGGIQGRIPETPHTETPPPDSIAAAGIPNDKNTTETRTLVAGSILGTTYYGQLADSMLEQQKRTLMLEKKATVTIRQAAAQCAGAMPTPIPLPTPEA